MKVQVERVKERIYLRSTGPTPGLSRAIPGANFSKTNGPHWSMPLSMEVCRALRERFGRDLQIGPALSEWAREAISRETSMSALSESGDAKLAVLPERYPVLAAAMESRTYQRVGARFIAEGRNVLVADQPGLGKTLEALGGIIEIQVPGPYLVVCPKTAVESVWAPEVKRWIEQLTVTVPDGRPKRDAILNELLVMNRAAEGSVRRRTGFHGIESTWVVVHPEMVRTKSFWECKECRILTPIRPGKKELSCGHDPQKAPRVNEHEYPQLFAVKWGAIICDESDRVLIRRSGTPTLGRNGMELLPLRQDGMRIALSGTPTRGKPHQLWGTLNWLRPKEYTSFWTWAAMYYEVEEGYGGSRTIGRVREDREEALYRSLSTVMIRRTKSEVAKDLPAKTYVGSDLDRGLHGVWLDMEPAQQRAYEQMMKDSIAQLDGGDLSAIGILAEMTRMKQFAVASGKMLKGSSGQLQFNPVLPSNKFNYVSEWLEENGFPEDPQGKLVVVSQFTQILDMFDHELRKLYAKSKAWTRYGSSMLTGKVTGLSRADSIKRFNGEVQSPTEHVMFLNVKAGGVAITLDTADTMIHLDETWIPDDQEQVEDRIHRVSRPRPVFYHYLRSRNSIDEHIARVNEERASDTQKLLDGRRGVEYARRILEVARG